MVPTTCTFGLASGYLSSLMIRKSHLMEHSADYDCYYCIFKVVAMTFRNEVDCKIVSGLVTRNRILIVRFSKSFRPVHNDLILLSKGIEKSLLFQLSGGVQKLC